MKQEDIPQVVDVHIHSFPGFFLSFLGPRFLRLYYSNVCSTSDGISFVYLGLDGKVKGFIAGTTNPRGFYYRLLKKNWLGFFWASIPAICSKPLIVSRLIRAITFPSSTPFGEHVAGLFSIGVLPGAQRSGAGRQLVIRFLEAAKRKGCLTVFLTTDRDNNEHVNNFYCDLGFTLQRQYETPEGRRMNEYWINLKA
jgi:ribosomal protein S18 acetylase RimI-like enzyme